MNQPSSAECLVPTVEQNLPTLDQQLLQVGKRVEALLQWVQPGLKLIERNGQPQFRIELMGAGWQTVSPFEAVALGGAYHRLNVALQKGVVRLTPGFDSLKLVQLEAALDALAPGIFDAGRIESALSGSPPLLAAVSGQWFPPGICIDLTPAETNKLIALLAAGGALGGFLTAIGIGAPWAAPVGAALALQAAAIRLAQAMSATGAVGFKITGLPPMIVVVPYPI